MRKPRDYDSELKALNERARALRERKQRQYGELVTATGADALPLDVLAGALIWAAEAADTPTKEGWRRRGAAFFCPARKSSHSVAPNAPGGSESAGGAPPLFSGAST
jgi:hypothetical protein